MRIACRPSEDTLTDNEPQGYTVDTSQQLEPGTRPLDYAAVLNTPRITCARIRG